MGVGTNPKPVKAQNVTVGCTSYEKDCDLCKKFWSTKDSGLNSGMGSVIKGWDEGVLTMQSGEAVHPGLGLGCKWLNDMGNSTDLSTGIQD